MLALLLRRFLLSRLALLALRLAFGLTATPALG